MQCSRHADLLAHRNAAVLVAGLLLTLATIGSCTHQGAPASGDPAESDVAVHEAPRQDTGSRSGQDEAGAAGGESGNRAKHPRSSPALEEALRQAAFDGRLNAVRAAIKDGADVSACDGEGRTALMLAAFGGHHEIVDVLLAHGTDVNQRRAGRFHGADLRRQRARSENRRNPPRPWRGSGCARGSRAVHGADVRRQRGPNRKRQITVAVWCEPEPQGRRRRHRRRLRTTARARGDPAAAATRASRAVTGNIDDTKGAAEPTPRGPSLHQKGTP